MDHKFSAQQILPLIDLTSLNDNDNSTSISSLCQQATTPYGNVAAVCVFSNFLPLAIEKLGQSNIKTATVVNFPHGQADVDLILCETELALGRGADEIDLVFPYHELKHGNKQIAEIIISEVRELCTDAKLKVIVESGELQSAQLITLASQISLDNGADFLKTSTGKVAVNATLEAAKIMLEAIKAHGGNCGFKAAGGIKTVAQAVEYIELAKQIMGESYIDSKTLRFGASSLLHDALAHLGSQQHVNNPQSNY